MVSGRTVWVAVIRINVAMVRKHEETIFSSIYPCLCSSSLTATRFGLGPPRSDSLLRGFGQNDVRFSCVMVFWRFMRRGPVPGVQAKGIDVRAVWGRDGWSLSGWGFEGFRV